MSAWLCDPYHVGRLAQWLCMRTDQHPRGRFRGLSHALQPDVSGAAFADPLRAPDGIDGDPVGECAAAVAVILGRANVASIEERYGDRAARMLRDYHGDGERSDFGEYLLACRTEARKAWELHPHTALEVLQACLCFEYQSCETGDAWKASTAAALIRQAVSYAHGRIIPRGCNGWPLRRPAVHAAVRADADSASGEELEAASEILDRARAATNGGAR